MAAPKPVQACAPSKARRILLRSASTEEKRMNAGKAYLAENAKKEGVVTTPSGLQYRVLREGNGPKPEAGGEVEVHYEGRLIDGTIFDSSYQRGEPISFLLNQVIEGWREGVQLMPVGSKYEFTIPSELAYGPQGVPGIIPPNAPLIFEVELLRVY
ncbi:MAG: FKBP-type peptidyl-prolyl cis-trans isomerase [Chloroflexota bacterium]